MRLNHECVRQTLLFIEDKHKPGLFIPLDSFFNAENLTDFSNEDIVYTILQLKDAGFINGEPRYGNNQLVAFSCGGLTWKGSEFIDTIRDNTVWSKTKSAASKLSSVSLTILSGLATKILSSFLGLWIHALDIKNKYFAVYDLKA